MAVAYASREAPRTPLSSLCDQWMEVIKIAKKQKHERFGQYAEEGQKFYAAAHDFMFKASYAKGPTGFLPKDSESGYFPTFRVTVNKVFEAVALYGPTLYYSNPTIAVEALHTPGAADIAPQALGISPDDPYGMQAYQALVAEQQNFEAVKGTHRFLFETYSNWLQGEGNKKKQFRMAITETIVKGGALLMPELYRAPFSKVRYPRTRWRTIDDLQVDPDASSWEDVQWVSIRNVAPVNLVARELGLNRGWLKGKGQYESANMQGATYSGTEQDSMRRNGHSHDLIEYWEIYSKNGFGQRLRERDHYRNPKLKSLDKFGDYCYVVVSDGVPFPLNMPPYSLEEEDDEQLFMRTQWPIPFWMDEGSCMGWPFVLLSYYDNPDCVWPISIIRPAIGEIKFVNWCMSFLADKVASQCQTIVAVMKEAAADIQNQLSSGHAPFTVIELEKIFGDVGKTIGFIQSPNFPSDIWRMVAEVMEIIDRRTGLTELMYGQTVTSMRSATEANVKQQNLAIRPEDMNNQTEDVASDVAAKELQVARWCLEGSDVAPVLGPLGAKIWDEQVLTQDPDAVFRDFHFRVHQGSMQRPNKESKLRTLLEFGNSTMSVFSSYAMSGQVGPWNTFVERLGELMNLDTEGMLLPEPDPEQPDAEQQAMQAEIERKKAELEIKMQEAQFKLQAKAQEMALDAQMKQAEHQQDMVASAAKDRQQIMADAMEHRQDLTQDAQEHAQELEQDREAHELDMDQKREEGRLTLSQRARMATSGSGAE